MGRRRVVRASGLTINLTAVKGKRDRGASINLKLDGTDSVRHYAYICKDSYLGPMPHEIPLITVCLFAMHWRLT
jgi:hypothetical protein